MLEKPFVLTLSCMDRPGIVAAVTGALAHLGCNIAESNQFWDRDTGRFFMRIAFVAPRAVAHAEIEAGLVGPVQQFGLAHRLIETSEPQRVLILVSRVDHAALHLLYQVRVGRLPAKVVGVVSNHAHAEQMARQNGLAFHHLPIDRNNKADQEKRLRAIIEESGADVVILARYMQILSNELARDLFGRAINIHHSFLPSFKGARPYDQAHDRGVKLIGATAHYVTADLDEGPIIEQETVRVTHAMTPQDMVAEGRDIESRVLARAVKYHLEQRVMLNGQKTVVFT